MTTSVIGSLPEGRSAAPPRSAEQKFWDEAVRSTPFTKLLALKARCVGPLLAASFVFIVAMTLLAGYAKPFLAQKVAGAFNLGYLLILLTYVLCWAVSLIYVAAANRRFDAQAAAAVQEVMSRRSA